MKSSKKCLLIMMSVSFVFGVSCSGSRAVSSNQPETKKETVHLPEGIDIEEEGIDYFQFTEKEMVFAIKENGDVLRILYAARPDNYRNVSTSAIAKDEVSNQLKKFCEDAPPDRRIAYLKADKTLAYPSVVQFLDLVRKADIDRVGLVAVDEDAKLDRNAAGYEVKLPAEPSSKIIEVKPNPLTLVAKLDSDKRLTLNNEPGGTIADSSRLENALRKLFDEREKHAVFRENTYEIEKTVFLKVSKSLRYDDFLKMLVAVKRAGADPIGIQLDGLD